MRKIVHIGLVWVLTWAALGCTSPKAVVVSAHMSIRDYLKLTHQLQPATEPHQPLIGMSFPVLGIFNPEGQMVFLGDGTPATLPILNQSPHELSRLQPVASSVRLSDIVSRISEFEKHRGEISSGQRFTYLSISLEGCKACAIQDDAFEKVSGSQDVNINKLSLVLDE